MFDGRTNWPWMVGESRKHFPTNNECRNTGEQFVLLKPRYGLPIRINARINAAKDSHRHRNTHSRWRIVDENMAQVVSWLVSGLGKGLMH